MSQEEGQVLYRSRTDLASLGITTVCSVSQIEHLCRERDAGRLLNAPKSLPRPVEDVLFRSTLAVSDHPSCTSIKALGVNAGNARRGMETKRAIITLFDRVTAYPVASVGGIWITEVRIAALSALIVKHFACADPASIVFAGAGAQARSYLDAFLDLFPLRDVRVFGRGEANGLALSKKAEALGLTARYHTIARQAIEGADIAVAGPSAENIH